MKYPIYNKKATLFLSFVDWLTKPIPKRAGAIQTPKKILISNMAHLGDVLLTLPLVDALKRGYPNLRIGFLAGSSSKQLLVDSPIEWVHTVDHWKNNRTSQTKFSDYLKSRRKALQEIRKVGYDTALDCNFHFPNMAPFLWQAKIPIRIGFESAGLSSFLTHAMPWRAQDNLHATDSFFSLLQFLPEGKSLRSMPKISHHPREKTIIIHIGCGDEKREWPLSKWLSLSKKLEKEGYPLVFTGKGAREKKAVESLVSELHGAKNLCDTLNWSEFKALLEKSALLIGLESSAGHLAASLGTPAVLIYTSIHPEKIWIPFSENQRIIRKPPPCSPCFIGCQTMNCVQEIPVEAVYEGVKSLLR